MSLLYLTGSLRNPRVPEIANRLRGVGHQVFDDWYASGNEADEKWQAYEQQRGRTYEEALNGLAADHVCEYDFKHLALADSIVLILPAGKSAHIEYGWALGCHKPAYIYFDQLPERWDVMYKRATRRFYTMEGLLIGIPV